MPIVEALRRQVSEIREYFAIRGLGVAIALDKRDLIFIGAGEDGSGSALRQWTWFRAASITKMATGLAVLRLADRGLDLNQHLEDVLGQAPVTANGARIWQVLSHTAGLPRHWSRAFVPSAASPLDVEPVSAPGRFVYSNFGYDLLGLLIERHTGQSFEAVLRELVLEPLGVHAELGQLPMDQEVASIHGRDEDVLNWDQLPSQLWPSGGLVTTAEGMLALISGFTVDGFLDRQTRLLALRDHTGEADTDDRRVEPGKPWGLGVELKGSKQITWTADSASAKSFGHFGGLGCLAWRDPDMGLTWAIVGTKSIGRGHPTDQPDWAVKCWNRVSNAVFEYASNAK